MDETAPSSGLFSQYNVAVICVNTFDDSAAQKVVQTIRLHGGQAQFYHQNRDLLDLEGISHIISITFDFPEYDSACDALIPVVKPGWVDASLARGKIANPRQYNPDPRLFLSDVVVCCADLPEGDSDAIAGGVLAMGGLFTIKLTSQVTHIVALTMESEKCAVAVSKKLNARIVLPHWFDDCLKLGRRIDEGPYLLPDPEILRQPNDSPPRQNVKRTLVGAVHPDPLNTTLPTPLPAARHDLKVFQNRKVMLASDLGIGAHLKNVIETLITRGGGTLVSQVRKTDIYVCKYREGHDYKTASRLGKDVGNLAWLYYMITNDVWTSPMRRLLHYPIARKALPGFENLRISLSNYNGEARIYLENLITAAGAECTKTLKQNNTHLITAHIMSEKCAAAKDWGVHLVNHLWLEESYANWKMQSVSNSRYTHFPSRTNLGEVVGQTQMNRSALDRYFFTDDDVVMEDDEGPPSLSKQRHLDTGLANVPQSSPLALHDPSKIGGNPNSVAVRHVKEVRKMIDSDGHQTPAAPKFLSTGKENETPSTTGSRKSKDLAVAKIHDNAADIALFQKESKRVGGVVYGGRRKNDEDRIPHGRKRSAEPEYDTDESEGKDPKRLRAGVIPPKMHLLISGYKKWVGHPKVEDYDKKQLRSLGIIVTQDPARATHLVAPTILRTHKFISALAYAPTVISTTFVDASLESEELLNPNKFLLRDKIAEKRLGVSLALSVERAKENQNKLLQGRTIYCVENVNGGFETYKSIVEANGGCCNSYNGRPGTRVPSRRADSESSTTDDDTQNEVFLISSEEKPRLWEKFRNMAESSRKTARIVKPDWLIDTAMNQKLMPALKYEYDIV